MSKNKRIACGKALTRLHQVIDIDRNDPHALPGRVVGSVKRLIRLLQEECDGKRRRDDGQPAPDEI